MKEPSIAFKLTDADKHSGTWMRLAEHMRNRLDELRGKNDGDQTESQTAMLRGQIQCLKSLLALGDDQPAI